MDKYFDIRSENITSESLKYSLSPQRAWTIEKTNGKTSGSILRFFSNGLWSSSFFEKEDFQNSRIISPQEESDPGLKNSPINICSFITDLIYQFPEISKAEIHFSENFINKKIHSSNNLKGVSFDKVFYGIYIYLLFSDADKVMGKDDFSDAYHFVSAGIEELIKDLGKLESFLKESLYFFKNSIDAKEGIYPIVLSPQATGLFVHECIGHKCEADYYSHEENIGDSFGDIYLKELNICDDGSLKGPGFTPFDDEGTASSKTYIIKNGIFQRPLTNKKCLYQDVSPSDGGLTGNGRAVSFKHMPMVRMTSTFIENGSMEFEHMISSIERGIYVKNIEGGFGMSDFSLSPYKAYLIEHGKITTPLRISLITGNVNKALKSISAICNDFRLHGFAKGGCGKFDQWPLPVGFGGPHIKLEELEVIK